ncbi:hypothetical protein FB45DRAFT_935477 [Roridomyces roridus]|uniref:FAD dependent oxidoreductase domain-containing protein n=1 Tax=Roridomyces roridus TaxID=1738132 RepID=A0AAD7BB18_9AGAR|nr:hypothetical protein FB45DRAFT_935477 [Roridomyces roridus]
MTAWRPKQITVIGAGVIGLTTAIKLQEMGYRVTIVAEFLPTDEPSPAQYTSHWAGGHHCTAAPDNSRQQKMDMETFRVFWEMSKPGHPAEKCFIRTPQYEHYFDDRGHPKGLEAMPDFKILSKSELLPGAVSGVSFTIINFDPSTYLPYLHQQFLDAGGKMVRGSVQHIKQVVEGGAAIFESGGTPAPPDAVIVCAGLGARKLGGVDDKTVTSVRGQTVILHAPWVKFGATRRLVEDGMASYIIPRRNGNVVLGGTGGIDDWYPLPRPETKVWIMERALALWPEIAPPEIREERNPTIDDLYRLIVGEGVGFRPERRDGIRLEVEWVEANGSKAPVVFHYGHGSSGFESSWGSALMAVELLEGALKERV